MSDNYSQWESTEHSFVHNLLALNIAGHMNTELIQQHGTTRKFCLHESS